METARLRWKNEGWHLRLYHDAKEVKSIVEALVGAKPKEGSDITISATPCDYDDEDAIHIKHYVLTGFYFPDPQEVEMEVGIPYAIGDDLGFIENRMVQQYYHIWVRANYE